MTQMSETSGSLSALKDALSGEDRPSENVRPEREAKSADRHGWWWAVGRRKAAVARCRLRPTNDEASVRVQKTRKLFKTPEQYFSETQDIQDVYAPLVATGTGDKLELVIRVTGGGHTAQAQAIRLAIARALLDYDPSFENVLRENGYLTVDARKVERKKYGQPGARRRFQFSKR